MLDIFNRLDQVHAVIRLPHGALYFWVTLALGLGFLGFALAGLRAQSNESWSRSFFLYSLIYLTALFAMLVIDGAPLHAG